MNNIIDISTDTILATLLEAKFGVVNKKLFYIGEQEIGTKTSALLAAEIQKHSPTPLKNRIITLIAETMLKDARFVKALPYEPKAKEKLDDTMLVAMVSLFYSKHAYYFYRDEHCNHICYEEHTNGCMRMVHLQKLWNHFRRSESDIAELAVWNVRTRQIFESAIWDELVPKDRILREPLRPVAFKSYEGKCINRLPFDIDSDIDFAELQEKAPIIAELLDRCDKPEELAAWFFSRFLENPYRKQYLWLWSTEANTYKSTLLDCLTRQFGDAGVVASDTLFKSSTRFKEQLIDKAVLGFDEVGEWFADSKSLKEYTGATTSYSVDRKGLPAVSVKASASIMATSNYMPVLDTSDTAKLHRLLLVQIRPVAEDYSMTQGRFMKAMDDGLEWLLRYGRGCYGRVADEQGKIKVDIETMRQDLQTDDIGEAIEKFGEHFNDQLQSPDQDGNVKIRASDFSEFVKMHADQMKQRETALEIKRTYSIPDRSTPIKINGKPIRYYIFPSPTK